MLAVPSYGYDGFLWEVKHKKQGTGVVKDPM